MTLLTIELTDDLVDVLDAVAFLDGDDDLCTPEARLRHADAVLRSWALDVLADHSAVAIAVDARRARRRSSPPTLAPAELELRAPEQAEGRSCPDCAEWVPGPPQALGAHRRYHCTPRAPLPEDGHDQPYVAPPPAVTVVIPPADEGEHRVTSVVNNGRHWTGWCLCGHSDGGWLDEDSAREAITSHVDEAG